MCVVLSRWLMGNSLRRSVRIMGYFRMNRRGFVWFLVSFYSLLSIYSIGVKFSSTAAPNVGIELPDEHFPVQRRPWLVFANKSDCVKATRRRLTATSGPLPTVSLLSVQGSGNTWLRWLIERLTGICTGSVYQETQMVDKGFKCEMGAVYNGMTIVQKSHYFHHHKAEKTLLLVRFPFDALVSDYHRTKTKGNHTGIASAADFTGLEWDNFVTVRAGEWFSQILTTLTHSSDLHVVFYENLLTHPQRELLSIAEFLQVYVTPERLQCVLKNQEGKLRRRKPGHLGVMGSPEAKAFTPVQSELVDLTVARAVAEFQARKIRNIPLSYRECSEKVLRLLQNRQKFSS